MEGGLGDHLLANRFGAAIREKYPNAKISLYSDTEGNPSSSKLLMELFSDFYDCSHVISHRKEKDFTISTRFGKEHYPSHLSNMPDDVLNEFSKSDKFYDLHIDGLKWLKYDFDWLRYYYFFPKPKINFNKEYHGKNPYLLCHLFSRPDSPYILNKEYTIDLLKKFSRLIDVVVITTEEHRNFYNDLSGISNIHVLTPDLKGCFSLASECSAFLGIDSGIRYIPYHFSKPVFVFSKYCEKYGQVAPSHLARWLIFEKNVFPMHLDQDAVCKVVQNSITNSAYQIFPYYLDRIEDFIVDRKL
jgi:hypothetical protein